MRFPEASGLSLAQVWQITPGRAESPTWSGAASSRPRSSIRRRRRKLGAGGGIARTTSIGRSGCPAAVVCACTPSCSDPHEQRPMGIAISTAGFYRTDDGGASWRARNAGRARRVPSEQASRSSGSACTRWSPSARPERLFLQNHWGLYRSDDWGDSWHDIANGVPSDFGFAMQMHPHDPDTVYIVPLKSDEFRVVPDAKLRVYRTQRRGRDVGAARRRTAAAARVRERAARRARRRHARSRRASTSARAAASCTGPRTTGETWTAIADALPPICCVKTAVISPRLTAAAARHHGRSRSCCRTRSCRYARGAGHARARRVVSHRA